MSVLVIVEAQIKSGELPNMKSYLKELLPDTRKFEGCKSLDVYSNTEDYNNIVFVEEWVSPSHYKKYHAWRTETGAIENIRSMIDGKVKIQFFERIDV
jgi:quinol monooxygenase YgiN